MSSVAEYNALYYEANKELILQRRLAYSRTPKGKYNVQRTAAAKRGIEWKFTFETWWALWEPFWDKRGRTAEGLVMCRYNDSGPYCPTNVYLDTQSGNMRTRWELHRGGA